MSPSTHSERSRDGAADAAPTPVDEPAASPSDRGHHVALKDIYNAPVLKRAIDDAVVDSLSSDRPLDHRLGDLRLFLGASAVAVALVAQFWPGNHVSNRTLLVTCVALYAAISAALWALGATVDRDVVARISAAEGSEQPGRPRGSEGRGRAAGSGARAYPLVVRSKLPRGSEVYELRLEARAAASAQTAPPPEPVVVSTSVGSLVHASGHVSDQAVDAFVQKALGGFDATGGKKARTKGPKAE